MKQLLPRGLTLSTKGVSAQSRFYHALAALPMPEGETESRGVSVAIHKWVAP